MSTTTTRPDHLDDLPSGYDGPPASSRPVVVRRNAGLAALVGAAASAIAIAYLWRAIASAAPLDWGLCLLMAGIAAFYLATLVDARTPLLVADDLGVRIRLGNQWRGLPWDAVDRVVVEPSRGAAKDGRLMFAPHSLGRALDGLDARGRRAAALNQRLYGAALAVPMGLTTRVSPAGPDLATALETLSRGRAVLVVPQPREVAAETGPDGGPVTGPDTGSQLASAEPDAAPQPGPVDAEDRDDPRDEHRDGAPHPGLLRRLLAGPRHDVTAGPGPDASADEPLPVDGDVPLPVEEDQPHPAAPVRPLRSRLGGIGTVVSRVAKRSQDAAPAPVAPVAPMDLPERPAAAAVVPLREPRHAMRAQVTRDLPASVLGSAALRPDLSDHRHDAPLPEHGQLRRPAGGEHEHETPDQVPGDGGPVRSLARLADPVAALVVDDFVTEPAYDPVIGPELAAARNRVGLSVDELAERTRIRPHVIESIEVDDFGPCGGDFYARGHLRTLARVLGRDAGPLLAQFDERYATAPINARRVFEAELATGMTGSMRSTVGGPNWMLMVGVVLALVLTWGVIRLVATEPPQTLQNPAPAASGSAGVSRAAGAAPAPLPKPIRVTLLGARDGSRAVVRDRAEEVVWAGEVALGERRTVSATPPVRVRAQDGGALTVSVNGQARRVLGAPGSVGRATLVGPAAR